MLQIIKFHNKVIVKFASAYIIYIMLEENINKTIEFINSGYMYSIVICVHITGIMSYNLIMSIRAKHKIKNGITEFLNKNITSASYSS